MNKGSRKYLAAVIVLFIGLMLISGCSTQVVLPGLCYGDRTGTHLCPEQIPEIKRELEEDMEEFDPLYKECEDLATHDNDLWFQCIMNEQERRELLKRMA